MGNSLIENHIKRSALKAAVSKLQISESVEEDFRGTAHFFVDGSARAVVEVALAFHLIVGRDFENLSKAIADAEHKCSQVFSAEADDLFLAIAIDSTWEGESSPIRNLICTMNIVRMSQKTFRIYFEPMTESLSSLQLILSA